MCDRDACTSRHRAPDGIHRALRADRTSARDLLPCVPDTLQCRCQCAGRLPAGDERSRPAGPGDQGGRPRHRGGAGAAGGEAPLPVRHPGRPLRITRRGRAVSPRFGRDPAGRGSCGPPRLQLPGAGGTAEGRRPAHLHRKREDRGPHDRGLLHGEARGWGRFHRPRDARVREEGRPQDRRARVGRALGERLHRARGTPGGDVRP